MLHRPARQTDSLYLLPFINDQNIEKPQELTFANGKSYEIRAKELEWNGLPAYTLFINDITDKITSSRKPSNWNSFIRPLSESSWRHCSHPF